MSDFIEKILEITSNEITYANDTVNIRFKNNNKEEVMNFIYSTMSKRESDLLKAYNNEKVLFVKRKEEDLDLFDKYLYEEYYINGSYETIIVRYDKELKYISTSRGYRDGEYCKKTKNNISTLYKEELLGEIDIIIKEDKLKWNYVENGIL